MSSSTKLPFVPRPKPSAGMTGTSPRLAPRVTGAKAPGLRERVVELSDVGTLRVSVEGVLQPGIVVSLGPAGTEPQASHTVGEQEDSAEFPLLPYGPYVVNVANVYAPSEDPQSGAGAVPKAPLQVGVVVNHPETQLVIPKSWLRDSPQRPVDTPLGLLGVWVQDDGASVVLDWAAPVIATAGEEHVFRDVASGFHGITVSKPGFKSYHATVEVPGPSLRVPYLQAVQAEPEPEVQQTTGLLVISGTPAGVRVLVDGRELTAGADGAFRVLAAAAGSHSIEVRGPAGYESLPPGTVEVLAGRTNPYRFALRTVEAPTEPVRGGGMGTLLLVGLGTAAALGLAALLSRPEPSPEPQFRQNGRFRPYRGR